MELQVPLTRIPEVWCYNTSTLHITRNLILHARTKYIELDFYFVREKVQQKLVEVMHVPSSDQIADVLTKVVSRSCFSSMRTKLKVESLSTLSLKEDVRSKRLLIETETVS